MNTTYHTTTQLTELSLFNPCQSISSYQVCRPPVFQDDRWRPRALGQLHWPAHWRDRQDRRPLAGWEWHQVSYEKCPLKKKHEFSINISFCLKVRHPILSYSIHWLIINFPIQLFFWGRGGGIPHVQTNNDKPIKQQKMRFVVRMVLSKYINKKIKCIACKIDVM